MFLFRNITPGLFVVFAAPGADGGGSAAGSTAAPPSNGSPAGGGSDVDHLAGLYDLSTAPETSRGDIEAALQQIRQGLAPRLQEHDEFRQRWEPLAGVEGLADLHPEDVDQLVELAYMMEAAGQQDHPQHQQAVDALREALDGIGEQFNLWDPEEGDPAAAAAATGEDEIPPWAQQIMDENRELRERLDGNERTSITQDAERQVAEELASLSEQHSLDEDAQNRVLQLAYAYGADPQALNKGLADYFAIKGEGEAGLIEHGAPTPGPTTPPNGQTPAPNSGEPMRLGDRRLRDAAIARMQGVNASGAAA